MPELLEPTLERTAPKISQINRVLFRLGDGPTCGTEFLEMHLPRYAARIWELRHEGFNITTRKCRQHRHTTRQIEYVLE
jgi:hypothetical protein